MKFVMSNFQTLTWSELNRFEWLASYLHNVSKTWWEAILPRSEESYGNAIAENRAVVVIDKTKNWVEAIVWSAVLTPLNSNFAEVSTVHVDHDYENHGIGSMLVKAVKNIANERNLSCILTVKPSIKWNEWMSAIASHNWFVFVPFSFLKNFDTEAFLECCCCDTFSPEKWCKYSSCYCMLWIDAAVAWAREASLEYVKSNNFLRAMNWNDRLTKKIDKDLWFVRKDVSNRVTQILPTPQQALAY